MFHSEKQNTRQTGMVLMENSESLHMIHKHEREREGKGREGEGEGEGEIRAADFLSSFLFFFLWLKKSP